MFLVSDDLMLLGIAWVVSRRVRLRWLLGRFEACAKRAEEMSDVCWGVVSTSTYVLCVVVELHDALNVVVLRRIEHVLGVLSAKITRLVVVEAPHSPRR